MNRAFFSIFRWHSLRYVIRHKTLLLLNVLSIALGTAVYLAIQIANRSANESLAAAVDVVAGKAHLEVRGEIDELEWPRIRHFPGVKESTAVVEGLATLVDVPGEYLRIVGVDLFSAAPFVNFQLGAGTQEFDLDAWLGRRGQIAITDVFAREHQLHAGSEVRLLVGTRIETVTIVSLIETEHSLAAAQPRLAAVDLGWAQEMFNKQGHLDGIQLMLDQPGRVKEVQAALQATLRPDCRVQPPRQRSAQLQTMLSAFRLNLTALSLVSLLVGAFLIYNTTSASVTRRQVELGVLRACGASQWQVQSLFICEAGCAGLLGVAFGVVGGIGLGGITSALVGRTVSSLYTLLSIDRLAVSPGQCLLAAIIGLTVVIAAAWIPAREGAMVDTAACLSGSSHTPTYREKRRLPLFVLVSPVLAVVCGWIALARGPAWLAFASAFFTMVTFAAVCPTVTRVAVHCFRLVDPSQVANGFFAKLLALWRIAADRMGRVLRRSSVTGAALAMAIAMTVGLTVMIYAFRNTVVRWVEQTVIADLYIAPASNETVGLGAVIPRDVVEWVRARVGGGGVDTFREIRVEMLVNGSRESVLLAVVDGSRRNIRVLGDERMLSAKDLTGAVVSESFSRRHRVSAGSTVELSSPRGVVKLPIQAVYRDYTRDEGVILIPFATFGNFWSDEGPQSMAVYFDERDQLVELERMFRERFGSGGEYNLYSNRALRQRILEIFDSTFAVTRGLRIVALAVAILGIGLSVTTLVAERRRETGILRAMGCSQSVIRLLFATEAAMICSVASVVGTVGGLALAVVLTWVVNPAYFGWTIEFAVPWLTVVSFSLSVIGAGFVAAWIPAGEAAHSSLAEAVREE